MPICAENVLMVLWKSTNIVMSFVSSFEHFQINLSNGKLSIPGQTLLPRKVLSPKELSSDPVLLIRANFWPVPTHAHFAAEKDSTSTAELRTNWASWMSVAGHDASPRPDPDDPSVPGGGVRHGHGHGGAVICAVGEAHCASAHRDGAQNSARARSYLRSKRAQ